MKKRFSGRLVIAVICIVIGMIPLLTYVNTMESGKWLIGKSFGKQECVLVDVEVNNGIASYKLFKELAKEMPEIQELIPIASTTVRISSYKESEEVLLKATDSSYCNYAALKIIKGSFIQKENIEKKQNTIVIDEYTADKIFGTTDILGRTVDIEMYGINKEAVVIGICKRSDLTESKADKNQGIVYIPITMVDENVTQYDLQQVLMVVKGMHIEEIQDNTSYYLNRAGISITKDNIISIEQVELLNNFADDNSILLLIMGVLWIVMSMMALINVLLLYVEQNKSYYGLLSFYGNSKKKIRQYLYIKAIEMSAICSLFSAFFGLLASFVLCWCINLPIYISIHSLTLSVIIPVFICIAAAFYPAFKAANTDANSTIWGIDSKLKS